MKFKKVSGGNAIDIKIRGKGASVEGVYSGNREIRTKLGPQTIYNFTDPNGGTFGVFGFSALNFKMESVPVGKTVRITYDGVSGVKNNYGKYPHLVTVEIGEDGEDSGENIPF